MQWDCTNLQKTGLNLLSPYGKHVLPGQNPGKLALRGISPSDWKIANGRIQDSPLQMDFRFFIFCANILGIATSPADGGTGLAKTEKPMVSLPRNCGTKE